MDDQRMLRKTMRAVDVYKSRRNIDLAFIRDGGWSGCVDGVVQDLRRKDVRVYPEMIEDRA